MDPAIFEEVAEGYDAGMAKGYLAREIVPSHKFHFGKTSFRLEPRQQRPGAQNCTLHVTIVKRPVSAWCSRER